MADNKKYYYMRLKENFFDTDEMLYLEGLEEGYLFSNILLKLYLRSLKNDGVLMMNEAIPYDARMISKFTGHSLSTVEKALFEFKKLKLIEVLDSGQMYMSNIELFVGKASTEADRKREARKNIQKKMEIGTNVGQMSDKRSPEKELELELEIEKKKDNNTRPKFSTFDMEAAEYLLKRIRDNNPEHKQPNLENWAKTFRLIREKDNRTEQQIMFLIDWVQNDKFWKPNVLSPNKLREKWDQLVMKMKSQNDSNSNKPKNNFMEALNERARSSNFINNDSKLLPF